MAVKKVAKKVKESQEAGARRDLLRELFNDLHSSRKEVYKVNFFRGVFFGIGSVVGGTVIVAIALVVLGWLTDIPGGIGDFIQYIVNTVEQSRS